MFNRRATSYSLYTNTNTVNSYGEIERNLSPIATINVTVVVNKETMNPESVTGKAYSYIGLTDYQTIETGQIIANSTNKYIVEEVIRGRNIRLGLNEFTGPIR